MSSLDEFRRVNRRKASTITIGGFRPTLDPYASHFGLPPLSLPDEGWPEHDGRPLFFICQLNLTQSPHVPEPLSGLALLTVFIDSKSRLGQQNGDGWLLREYSSLANLSPLAIPEGTTFYRGFEVRFDEADDYPVFDDPDLRTVRGFDSAGIHLDNVARTKIGGYASNIQSEQWWGHSLNDADVELIERFQPAFCLQIATEEKVRLYLGDNGMMYFARSTAADQETRWFLDTQCY